MCFSSANGTCPGGPEVPYRTGCLFLEDTAYALEGRQRVTAAYRLCGVSASGGGRLKGRIRVRHSGVFLRLGLVALVALAFASAGARAPRALASIVSVTPSPASLINPNTGIINVSASETDGGGGIVVAVSAGTINLTACNVGLSACTVLSSSGGGTSSVSISSATDGDVATGELLSLQFSFTPPTVLSAQSIPLLACQGLACSPAQFNSVNVFPSGSSSVSDIFLVVSTPDLICGNSVTVTATITSSGVPVADGTLVLVSANNGNPAFTVVTVGGVATAIVPAPIGLNGTLLITVTSGGVSTTASVSVTCSVAGPPATILLTLTPGSVTCGSTASVIARVADRFGNAVVNGTLITLSSTLGSIAPTVPVTGGIATAVLTSFPRQPGTAVVTARAGDAVATGNVQVSCAAASPTQSTAPTAIPPSVAPTAAPTSGILPPNTGEAGLK